MVENTAEDYTMRFSDSLLQIASPQWSAMLAHPFLQHMADGTLPTQRFETWLRQDYIFVREDIGVIGCMLARAPVELRRLLGDFIPALHRELDLFESMANEIGVSLEQVEPAPICHAYTMFLLATAQARSFAESFAVLYGAEKAYGDSWRQVKTRQTHPNRYQRFIDHWGSDAFAAWVDELAQALDRLVEGCGPDEQLRMEQLFRLTVRYEYLFWNMALTGSEWPV
jgi:thiaminase/transcriptional activator TenA